MQYRISHDGRSFLFRSYSSEDAIARRMRKYAAFYERDLLDYSRTLLFDLPAGGLVVDIGANFGNHSVFWAAHAARHVVAIESNPELAPLLAENLAANASTGDFTVIAGGAGERSALARVRHSARAPGQFGLAGIDIDANLRADDAGVFEVHSLAHWLVRIGRDREPVRLLKIDVEGGEIPVISGAIPILERDRPEIFAEAATSEELDALDVALAPWGYRRVKRFCSTPTWHYTAETSALTLWRWRRHGAAARIAWRCTRIKHSISRRLRRAA